MMNTKNPVDLRIMTRGFRHGIDATIASAAVMVAIGLASGGATGYTGLDVIVAGVLFVTGYLAGIPGPLLVASSIPANLLVMLLPEHRTTLLAGLALVRIIRVAWNLYWFAGGASNVGRELAVLFAQTSLLALSVILGGTISLYVAEHNAPGSSIKSIWDALWAVIVTTTTVGYGDIIPVTPEGKFIAGTLMVLGVGIMMFLLSNLATIITKVTVHEELESMIPPAERAKREIIREVQRLEELDDEEFQKLINLMNTVRIIEGTPSKIDEILNIDLQGSGRKGEAVA